jgi:hypothetical protein
MSQVKRILIVPFAEVNRKELENTVHNTVLFIFTSSNIFLSLHALVGVTVL